MTGFREEFFGPVLSVHRFDEVEEGLALAAHPTYGLAASVHTTDIREGAEGGRRDRGRHGLDQPARSRTGIHLPAGGFKASGFGKDMGRAGIEAFTRQKAVWVNYAQ